MPLVEAARFYNRIEAELARMHLEAGGIDAILFDAEMNSFGLGPIMPVRLMVLDEQLEDARALLSADAAP